MTKNKKKLYTALIEQGKEVEQIKGTPTTADMQFTLDNLKTAEQLGDMKGIRVYSRKLAAQATKLMIDKV